MSGEARAPSVSDGRVETAVKGRSLPVPRWAEAALLCLIIAVSCWVYRPALHVDYAADDFWQIAALEGLLGPESSPLDLYVFADDDPEGTRAHVERGSLPWWTTPGWQFAMIRPLSSLTIALDHWLLPRAVYAHHLHSLAWLVLVWLVSYVWLRDLCGPVVGLVALAGFTIDDSVGLTLGWVANRCALVSMCFAMAALVVHQRRTGLACGGGGAAPRDPRAWTLELALWFFAFAGSEYATCAVAYLVAMQIFLARTTPRQRLRDMGPSLLMTIAFVAMFSLLGGSASGLAEYADPIHNPGRYLSELGHKIPRLVAETWLSVGGDSKWILSRLDRWPWLPGRESAWLISLPTRPWRHALIAAIAVGVALPWGAAAARGLTPERRRLVLALVVGSVLSCLPLSSTVPQTRLLVFPSLGPALALVLLLQGGVARWRLATGGVSRLVATASCVAVLGLLYVDLVEDARRMRWQTDIVRRAQLQLRYHLSTRDVSAPEVDDAHVVVISAPGFILGVHGLSMHHVYSGRRPASFHTLTYGQRACLLRRTSASSFELDAVGVPFMTDIDERSFRRVSQALEVGAPVDVGLFEASVLRARGEGEVDALRFDFDRPLEDRSLIFVTSTSTGLRRLELPPVGGSVLVPLPRMLERIETNEVGGNEVGGNEVGGNEVGGNEAGGK